TISQPRSADAERVDHDPWLRGFRNYTEQAHRTISNQPHPDPMLAGLGLEREVARPRMIGIGSDASEPLAIELDHEVTPTELLMVLNLEPSIARVFGG